MVMNQLHQFILDNYEYNEPIFTNDLAQNVRMSPASFRQAIKRLSDKGVIQKVEKGIYFVPSPNSFLKNPVMSVDRIVIKRYIERKGEQVGYKTGINFANSLGLTTQTASVPTVVTNETASIKREVIFNNKKVILRKPRANVQVTKQNYKLLQVLDLLSDFERVSEEPLEEARKKIMAYLKDVRIAEEEFQKCLKAYPDKTKVKVYELGVQNELTRKSSSLL